MLPYHNLRIFLVLCLGLVVSAAALLLPLQPVSALPEIILLSPANNQTQVPNPSNLAWCPVNMLGQSECSSNSDFSFSYDIYICAGGGCVPQFLRNVRATAVCMNNNMNMCLSAFTGQANTLYRWQILGDNGGSIYASGIWEYTTVPVPPPADLIIRPAVGWTSSANQGATVIFPFTTENVGGTAANNFRDALYIDGVQVGSVFPRSVAAGSSNSNSLSWPAAGCGSHTVEMRTDVGTAILESNEFNNAGPAPAHVITVVCPQPDLVISSITTSGTACVNQPLNINAVTRNQGVAPASPSITRVMVNTSSCEIGVGSLIANQQHNGSCAVTPTVAGSQTVTAIADSQNDVPGEANESNNSSSVVVSIGAAPPAPTGLNFTNVSPAAVTVNWSNVSGETGFQVLRHTANNLPAAINVSGTLAVDTISWTDSTVSANTTYYYWVRALNSCGNSTSNPNSVATSALADLVIGPAGAWSTTINQGQTVSFTFTTQNLGGTNANNFTDALYVDGVLAGSVSGRSAPAGGSGNTTGLSWTATGCGSHTVEVRTDVNTVVPESNENNNRGPVPAHSINVVCPLPDLTIPALTAASLPVCQNQPFAVDVGTTNSGAAQAGQSTTRVTFGANTCDVSVGSLAPGASHNGACNFTATTVGQQTLNGMADAPPSQVAESVETNNTASSNINVLSAPGAITGLAETTQTATSISWDWNDASGFLPQYEYRLLGSLTWQTASASNAVLSGLICNTPYTIEIRATNVCGQSPIATDPANTNTCAGITVTLTPPSQIIDRGQNTSYTVTATSNNGTVAEAVNFSLSGCPGGGTNCAFSAFSCQLPTNGSCAVTLNINNTSQTPPGVYTLTVTGATQGQNLSDSGTATLTINALDELVGDLNCDNVVDIKDLGILLSTNWWGIYNGGYNHPACGNSPMPPPPPPL